ncbi:Ger(x)C family spore germination protein [Candidatus Clostridium stratigraminis]|uniref:Ger(X)C family spore germination protein n=1 Tax=Candidatus Clostridium stratigraminis TaxID=3381661 RepID=A0ABW8T4B2_9CLOT
MKKIILSIFLGFTLFFNGCRGYNDVNRLLFVTTVIIDVDKNNMPIIYLEAFKPTRTTQGGSEKGERLLFKGTGKTVFEALTDINLSSSLKLNYTQNKVIMFTQFAAKYGIDNFIDIVDREQQFLVRPYIAVLMTSPDRILGAKIKSEEYIGIYIHDLIENVGASPRAIKLPINDYLNKRLIGSRTGIVTAVDLKKNQLEDIIEIEGGAIIKNDKMVDFMTKRLGLGYNFLEYDLSSGSLEITNPDNNNSFVTLRILNSKTKTNLTYDGELIHLNKRIKLKTSIADVQKNISFNDDELEKIKNKSKLNIEEACKSLFNKYKEENLDIFEIQEEFERKYPNVKLENVLKITELNLEIDETIEGSPDIQGNT